MDLLWDKKLKLNNYNRAISNGGDNYSMIGKSNETPGTKREINLLANRLNKLFPISKFQNK